MSQKINRYRCDLRDYKFLLFEQFRLREILGKGKLVDWGEEEVNMVLGEVFKWATEVVGPLNEAGDRQGCQLVDGKVKTPDGFAAAWTSLYESGWRGLGVNEKYGGQGGPHTLAIAANEIMSGANTSFNMYPGLTQGASEVIEMFGTEEQKAQYCKKLYTGVWAGTMCLTEPHAGSDVGASTTKAIKCEDGRYKIVGTKIYISCGQHELAQNIVHMVLARTEGSPPGTKGLSLFIVPRDQVDGSGSNHVICSSIEHKMGIKASATCVLNFGDGGDCIGELVGDALHVGMRQMFKLMNFSRIGVATQSLGVAGSAYLNALDYAKERLQGPSMQNFKDPTAPKVPIVEHADVRRMLLDMKARTEGLRALIVKLAMHADLASASVSEDDRAYNSGQLDLLVPLVKAYGSDQAFQIAATAIQVYGGAGYVQDNPVEQYCRDSKIFSIYEGTNHIQALDLVGRQLGLRGGANFQGFLKDISTFVAENQDNETFGESVTDLGVAAQSLGATAMKFLGWHQAKKAELIPLNANQFLEMMSVTAIAWLLLQQGILGEAQLAKISKDDPDRNFYLGKRFASIYFANQELGGVISGAKRIAREEQGALAIPTAAFSTL